jgi:DnaJ-class molecular chaperone
MTIEDKGLPFHKNPYKFGNLFVLFSVEFPKSLDSTQSAGIQTLFSSMKRKGMEDIDVAETCKL